MTGSLQEEVRDPTPQEVEDRGALVDAFVGPNAAYYRDQFERIGSRRGFVWTFNPGAAIFGPVWYGARGLWKWALPFSVVETFACVQIGRGAWGDLTLDLRERIANIDLQLDIRRGQLETATKNNADNVDSIRSHIDSLETFAATMQGEIQSAEANRFYILLFGLVLLLLAKFVQGTMANPKLERLYFDWLSDRSIRSGMQPQRIAQSLLFVLLVYGVSILHFSGSDLAAAFNAFPTDPQVRLTAIAGIEAFFDAVTLGGEEFFDAIAYGIRTVLDALETGFVQTPWIVILVFVFTLTALSAGPRAAIFSSAFLAYMGLMGLWSLSMQTLALLGTAACISISLGIPLGIYCARRPRVYEVIRPILDFQQTMPAFVYMIPVIAFFGTGKPAAIVTCMMFGMPPVVRLTVLGLQGVPASIREAAIAYGATKWYLLFKVDLPLAAPSIRTGMNQTILLSLLTVVVASLIGAKGLGEDVLEALQYASVGQGILAGFAILFIAMILDRIIQGRRDRQ